MFNDRTCLGSPIWGNRRIELEVSTPESLHGPAMNNAHDSQSNSFGFDDHFQQTDLETPDLGGCYRWLWSHLGWRWRCANHLATRPVERAEGYPDVLVHQVLGQLRPDYLPKLRVCNARHLRLDECRRIAADSELAFTVQARILSGQTHSEIAHRCELDTDVITDYRDIFFDVQRRMSRRGLNCLSGFEDVHWTPQEVMLLRLAFSGGPTVCERVLAMKPFLGQEHDLSTLTGRERERIELLLLTPSLIDTLTQPRHVLLLEQEGMSSAEPDTESVSLSNLLIEQVHQGLRQCGEKAGPLISLPITPSHSPLETSIQDRDRIA